MTSRIFGINASAIGSSTLTIVSGTAPNQRPSAANPSTRIGSPPGRVVVPAVASRAALLDHNPGVNRENSAPPYSSRGEDANKRLRMFGRRGKKPRARTIGGLPVAAAVTADVIEGGNDERSDDEDKEYQEVLFHGELSEKMAGSLI